MYIYLFSILVIILIIKIFKSCNKKKKSIDSLNVGISGCDTGLGRELSVSLKKQNANVYPGYFLSDRNKLDVTNNQSIDEYVASLPDDLNVFIHNAGIITSSFVEITDEKTFEATFDVNYYGVIRLTKKLLPILRKNKGRIIIISSITSRIESRGLAAYGSSKAALSYYANCLRREVEPTGVEVILIEPGMINTGLIQKSLLELGNSLDNLPSIYKIKKNQLSLVKWLADHSTSPQKAANRIIEIAGEINPKARYLIGIDAHILDIISHLPYFLSDLIL